MDYYGLLGVSPSATSHDIRRAYLARARQLHPDVNQAPGAAAEFSAVSEAFAVLRDPQKRAEHDRARAASARQSSGVHVAVRDEMQSFIQTVLGNRPGAVTMGPDRTVVIDAGGIRVTFRVS